MSDYRGFEVRDTGGNVAAWRIIYPSSDFLRTSLFCDASVPYGHRERRGWFRWHTVTVEEATERLLAQIDSYHAEQERKRERAAVVDRLIQDHQQIHDLLEQDR